MFEDMTYENLLNFALSRVSDDRDKREGSVVYDAIAPCVYLLAQGFFYLSTSSDLVLLDTAVDIYLDRVGDMYGVKRNSATNAVWRATSTVELEVGTRFGHEDITYAVVEELGGGEYSLQCEQLGSVGNTYTGELDNLDNVDAVVTLDSLITVGEDEETDEHYRSRIYDRVQLPATSGNVAHYKMWAKQVSGCGDCKVIPLWNGPGTVKLIVVDTEMGIDSALPDKVKEHVETLRPIGADVTVVSPTEKQINVAAKVSFDSSVDLETIQKELETELRAYISSLAFSTYIVSYARIGSIILTIPGVIDYSDLTVNGMTKNIVVADDEIPVVVSIELEELT